MAIIKGTDSANVINGTIYTDTIYAYGGNDTVYGQAGNDLIYGGSGNDKIFGGSGINTLYGGSGYDWFSMSARSSALSDDYIAGFEFGFDKVDLRAWGVSDFSQVQALLGNTADGSTLLNAYYGGHNHVIEIADTFASEAISSDFIYNTSVTNVTVNGTNYADVLFGGRGHDLIDGNAGSDKLLGGLGDDDIYGEAGNDQIWGGAGSDLLSGGTGDDIFRFASVSELTSSTGLDVITDFQINDGYGYDDLIDFSKIDADATRSGNQAFDFIGSYSFATYAPGELRYYYDAYGDTVVAGNTDNDAAAEFQLLLDGRYVLDYVDFIA